MTSIPAAAWRACRCLLLPAGLAGCAGEGGGAWPGTVEQVRGVTVVSNPARPMLAPGSARVAPLWAVSGEDGEAEWEQPTRLAVGEGRIYVLDDMASRVHAVSPEGALEAAFGRKGHGPGEFDGAFGIAAVPGGVVVGNGGRASLDFLGNRGEYRRSVRVGGVGFSVWGLGRRGVLVHALTGATAGWRLYREGGAPRRVWLPAPPAPGEDAPSGCFRVGTSEERVLQMSCTVPAFQVLDPGSHVLREVRIDRAPREASGAELAALRRKISGRVAATGLPPEAARKVVEDHVGEHRVRRLMQGVRADEAAGLVALWEQEPEELGGGPATLHLLSSEGVYLASLSFPSEWADFAIAGGRLYALEKEPETGLVRLAAYAVRLPPDALPRARAALRRHG